MVRFNHLTALLAGISALVFSTVAYAEDFRIPAGDLENALNAYTSQTGVQLLYAAGLVKGAHTKGVVGDMPADAALSNLLRGTEFTVRREADAIAIIRGASSQNVPLESSDTKLAQVAPPKSIETVTVTSSKLGGADVQSIPISITALRQQFTATQTAGGPDLIKQVPNMALRKQTSPAIAFSSAVSAPRPSR